MSKSKSINKYFKSKTFKQKNKRLLFDCLSNRSTFLGHPVQFCIKTLSYNEALESVGRK